MFHYLSKVNVFTRKAVFVAALGGLVLVAGCASDVEVSKVVTQPAEINMAGRTVVMLKGVSGTGGEKINSRLKDSLGTKGFTIVDRAGLSDRTTEGGITASDEGAGTGDNSKITSPGVIIRGKVLTNKFTQHVEHQVNSEGNKKKGTYREYYTWWAVGTQNVEVTFDVVDLHSLEVIKSASIKGSKQVASEPQPNFNNPQITDTESVQDDCYDQVVDTLMKKIAPFETTFTVAMLHVDDNPSNDAGIVAVQTSDYVGARASFDTALSAAKAKPKADAKESLRIIHNVASAYALEGKYNEAATNYTKSGDPVLAAKCKKMAKDAGTLAVQPHAE